MKYLVCLFLFLFTCSSVLAQTTDSQGRKQGYWKKKDEKTNRLIYEGMFKDDQPIGVFKYYNINDSVRAIIQFKPDGKTAYVQLFHLNGRRSGQGKYVGKEMKDSVWTYYDEAGILISKESYLKGKKNGKSYVYLPDGSVSEERSFVNGLEDGPYFQYFEKNLLRGKGQYAKGLKEGRFIYYYPNRVEVANGFYKNGLKNGPWIYRSEDGKITEKELFKNGVEASKKETEAFFSKNAPSSNSNNNANKSAGNTNTTKPAPKK